MTRAASPKSVTGWYVDTRGDSVVITVNKTKVDAAATAGR
ncbi:alpha-lytic protease prodomain-containing protein [Kibdelosporangium lantanae]|uniref:Alpha-lytic protease prodomain-containing protein n=1 Tax=Kibdelosporangium lantanae TaxID=1497396 RepID=A0ABW3ME56_9PSEU